MPKTQVVAFDFGASSGRAIKAVYDGEKLTLEECHRFDNEPFVQEGKFCWNFDDLMQNVRQGIKKAGEFDSVGVDTWGVDFGLLDGAGNLICPPVNYRDERTLGLSQKPPMGKARLYELTGIQLIDLNTIFQLEALKRDEQQLLDKTKTLLFMPDLFTYMLSGEKVCEKTIASTSQMLNPETGKWSREVLDSYGIPMSILPEIIESGTIVGRLKEEYGVNAKVIAVAGHDTQCAVAAMPQSDEKTAFLSCGTWSLLGKELENPVLTAESMEYMLSNEMGANGKVNYLTNIIGLWLIQESRREFRRRGQEYSYADLEREALAAAPLRSFIDPDLHQFSQPGDIPKRIQEFCRETGQPVPNTVGEIMRCIYESLALKYMYAIEKLEKITKSKIEKLAVLGGGSKDGLLCQMTADFCGIDVTAGPQEATALGNIIIQLIALGKLENIDEGRKLIAKTQNVKKYVPRNEIDRENAYANYIKIIKKAK